MKKIEVSAQEFARTNKGVVNLLRAIATEGEDGEIATRQLLKKIRMVGYGQVLIKRAVAFGYIKREKREPANGVGFWPVYNILTPKAKSLLQLLNNE